MSVLGPAGDEAALRRLLSEPPAANRAKRVIRRKSPVAITAGPSCGRWLRSGQIRSGIIGGPLAAVADKGRLAGFDPEHRNEKDAQIVVHPLEIGLMQSAPGAAPGGFFQDSDLGLDAAYEKEEAFDHGALPGLHTRKAAEIIACPPIFSYFVIHTTFVFARQAGADGVCLKPASGVVFRRFCP